MIYRIFNYLNKNKYFPYYICTPLPYAIGTAAENLRVGLRLASISNKKLLIIVPTILKLFLNYSLCNRAFFKEIRVGKLSKVDIAIKYIFSILINIQFLLNRFKLYLIKNFTKTELTTKHTEFGQRFPDVGVRYSMKRTIDFDEIKLPKHETYPVTLSERLNNFCLKKIKEMGINENEKFVCVHVRDYVYRNDKGRREFRNSDVNNYKEAILYLLSKGYWVIRTGQAANKKLDINNPKFIDYPFSKFKSDSLDLYLIKNCEFMICTQAGLLSVGYIFNKPILLTNKVRFFESFSANKISRTISKKPFWKKNNKPIVLEDYMKLKYDYHHMDFLNDEVDFVENNPNEILEATKEILANIENKVSSEPETNQFLFNKTILSYFKKNYVDTRDRLAKDNLYIEKIFNVIVEFKEGKECYSNFFLKKYFKSS